MKLDWREFFKDDGGRSSMTRLLMFMSFWPASYVVIANGNEGMLGWYLGAFAAAYGGGKVADAIQNAKAPVNVQNVENVSVENK